MSEGVPDGPIPAWAGEPRATRAKHSNAWAYPRVGGGTATKAQKDVGDGGLSPRGRGNPVNPGSPYSRPGPIPAWAGEPRALLVARRAFAPATGLSPRGRGNHPRSGIGWFDIGPIPAWAGEP